MAGTLLPVTAEGETAGTLTPDFHPTEGHYSGLAASYKKAAIVPYEDDEEVRVMISLEEAPAIEKYAAEGIGTNASAKAYRQKLKNVQAEVARAISEEVLDGEPLEVRTNLTLIANSMSAVVRYGQIEAIREVPGVKDVRLEKKYSIPEVQTGTVNPRLSNSGGMIGTNLAYAGGYTGAGSRIAIIDTGIDVDHQMFDGGGLMYSLAEEAGRSGISPDAYIESLNLLDTEEIASVLDQLHVGEGETADNLWRSAKIAFGYNYVDQRSDYIDHNDPRERETYGIEHGSHVAGIAAGNRYIANKNGTYSNSLETVYAQGVAPDAQLIVMKVFGINVSNESDYMNAIEDAVVLGADAVNLSLGGECGFTYELANPLMDVMDALEKSGIVVSVSAGNESAYPQLDTPTGYLYSDDVNLSMTDSPGSYTNSLSVASVENTGTTGYYFLAGDHMVFYVESNLRPLTTLIGIQDFVYIDGFGTDEEFAAVADILKGKIAVCNRGGFALVNKAMNAVENGAVATIVVNNESGSMAGADLSNSLYNNPAVFITQNDGEILKSIGTDGSAEYTPSDNPDEEQPEPVTLNYWIGEIEITGLFGTSAADPEAVSTDVYMSDFSCWGVPSDLALKPEISAPGGGIYSVNGLPEGGEAYEMMSGTSMAAPQIAGAAGVIGQYIRQNDLVSKTGLSARQLSQSLMMSTAKPIVASDGISLCSVLQQGAGLVDVGSAVSAKSYILMDESATISAADGKVKAELGHDPERTGEYSVKFTVNNMSDEDLSYTLDTDLFTQDILEKDGEAFLDYFTTGLDADITYTVDGEEFVPVAKKDADVDRDGDTDADDAQAILDFLVNTVSPADLGYEDSEDQTAEEQFTAAADVDGDGEVTAYDAHLVLTFVEEAGFTAAAGATVEITANIALTDAQKAELDEKYANGAYVEAYIYVRPTTSMDGMAADVEYSIPVIGFYGNWTDASAYDYGSYRDFIENCESEVVYYEFYDEYVTEYSYLTDRLPYSYHAFQTWNSGIYIGNVLVSVDENDEGVYIVGNPAVPDGIRPEQLYANGDYYMEYQTRNIRPASVYSSYLKNENGEIVWSNPEPWLDQKPVFYSPNYYDWLEFVGEYGYYFGAIRQTTDQTLTEMGFAEGDTVTMGTVVIPQLFTVGLKKEDITADWVVGLINSGELGEGAFLEETVVLDNTAPTVSYEIINNESGDGKVIFRFTAADNNWIAGTGIKDYSEWYMADESDRNFYLMLGYGPEDFAEEIMPVWCPDELGEKGQTITIDLDMTEYWELAEAGYTDPQYWYLYISDYAGNTVNGWIFGEQETDDEYDGNEYTPEEFDAMLKKLLAENEKFRSMYYKDLMTKADAGKTAAGGLNAITVDEENGVVNAPSDARVTVDVTAENSVSGLYAVSYDPAVLTLESVRSLDEFSAYNADDEDIAVIAYAAVNEVNGNVGRLVFSYDPYSGIDETTVTVAAAQDGEPGSELPEPQQITLTLEQADIEITAKSGPHGQIDPAGSQTVKAGDEVSYTVTPEEGFIIEAVLIDGKAAEIDENGVVTFTAYSDTNVYATFREDPENANPEPTEEPEPETVSVTLCTEGEGRTQISRQGIVEKGTEVTVTWAETYGYVLHYVNINGRTADAKEGSFTVTVNEDTVITVSFRILDTEFHDEYWWENGIIQGTSSDPQGVADTQYQGVVRGREIYDPATGAWYWLDAVLGGKPAKGKEVWMPYVFQGEEPGSTDGKWVRYDDYGHMIKGWYTNDNGTYYYDLITGAMAKGTVTIQGREYTFDILTGILQ